MKLIILTNYKGTFGSKAQDMPYRSGYNLTLLTELFAKYNFEVELLNFSEVQFDAEIWRNQYVIYTSSEEKEYQYKSFIEDVISGIKILGAKVIPELDFLKANNNKVFMEILMQSRIPKSFYNHKSLVFGTFSELEKAVNLDKISFPSVVKKAAGAKSRGVFLANNVNELLRYSKLVSKSFSFKSFVKEEVRKIVHKGYLVESQFQNKFIVQPFVKGLKNDWKILIYGEKYFILNRGIKANDFRASGSGVNYATGSESEFPLEQLDFIREFYKKLDVPNISIDFAFDGNHPYILEFQAIYFGTSTITMSKDFYEFKNGAFELQDINQNLEEIYVESIVNYIQAK